MYIQCMIPTVSGGLEKSAGRFRFRFSLTRPSFPMAVGSDEGLALGPCYPSPWI